MSDEQMMRWNGEDGRRWAAAADGRDEMLAPFLPPLLSAAALAPGDTVLDIGCGCGVTSFAAADAVTSTGRVVAADLSEPMLATATARAEGRSPVPEFVRADVATHRFEPDTFDVAISRFGVMFFEDPTAAFTNVARAVRPRGRLALAVWQPLEDNEWLRLVRDVVLTVVDDPPAPPEGVDPFAFGDPDWVRPVLEAAGWADVGFAAVRTLLHLGGSGTVDEAVEMAVTGGVGRVLLAGCDEATVGAARDALARAFAPHHDGTGVALGAAGWIVTARCAKEPGGS